MGPNTQQGGYPLIVAMGSKRYVESSRPVMTCSFTYSQFDSSANTF